MLFQVIKSIVLFFLMYFSLKFLGIASGAAIIASLIPLVLGMLNILTATAFGIAGLVFVLAAFSALLPTKYLNATDFVEKAFKDVSFERRVKSVTTNQGKPKKENVSIKDKN